MNDESDGRVVYSPRGRNAEDDLAACILRAAKIFMMDDRLVWITDGKRVPVFRDVVIELCRRFVVTEMPVERDGKWIVERRPFVPDELMVRNLIRESLPKRAPIVQPEAAPIPAEPPVTLPDDHPDLVAGRRALARYAGGASGERTRQEIERGQQRLKEFQDRPPQV
jgi:hypothetical protein